MERREALKLTALFIGGTIIGSETFLTSCASENRTKAFLTDDEIKFLDEVGETILPETERSPGAKAANIGEFMNIFVADCYSPKEQQIFKKGIEELDQIAKREYSMDFLKLDPQQKQELLVKIDKASNKSDAPHFFKMIKQLTILGYFTSEPGVTKALRYNPIPGEFIGCIPYEEGDKAFADRV